MGLERPKLGSLGPPKSSCILPWSNLGFSSRGGWRKRTQRARGPASDQRTAACRRAHLSVSTAAAAAARRIPHRAAAGGMAEENDEELAARLHRELNGLNRRTGRAPPAAAGPPCASRPRPASQTTAGRSTALRPAETLRASLFLRRHDEHHTAPSNAVEAWGLRPQAGAGVASAALPACPSGLTQRPVASCVRGNKLLDRA